MKYTITLRQQAMIDNKLNATQFAILDVISIAPLWASDIVIGKEVYFWTARQKIAEELKAFSLESDTVYRHLINLSKSGFIDFKKLGKKDCTRLTPRGKLIFTSASYNKNSYIGKKSEKDINAMSENDPKKIGSKSEKKLEINPTDTDTNLHTNTNNSSSFLSPPKKENETQLVDDGLAVTLDPCAQIPNSIDGLEREVIINAINAMATKRGGDFDNYRDSLIREILSGQGRTLTNIRNQLERENSVKEKPWIVENRKKRTKGEEMQKMLNENGYSTIFDAIEDMKKK